MEIFGGFMVMMSIISLFLAVVWLIMPFVVFAIKGKQDRTLEVLEGIEKRLAAIEAHIQTIEPAAGRTEPPSAPQPADTMAASRSASADASTDFRADNI
ncbi:MAG: hypothetical protein PHD54_06655 [Desulfuromonadaceae bacterium]|nr:hypothetical protein [Desulfuromonadaceae bacterium]